MAYSRHLTHLNPTAARGYLISKVPLPKGVSARKARVVLAEYLGTTPERIIEEALRDALQAQRKAA